MKKSILLALSIFATQFIFAQPLPSESNNTRPRTDFAVTLPETNDKAAVGSNFPQDAMGKTAGNSSANEGLFLGNRVDRIEFDAENGITLYGGTAADLLAQAACLTLDLKAYEQLPADSHILVLINQQPTPIRANQVTDALGQIPATRIKSIEISTGISGEPDTEGAVDIIIRIIQTK